VHFIKYPHLIRVRSESATYTQSDIMLIRIRIRPLSAPIQIHKKNMVNDMEIAKFDPILSVYTSYIYAPLNYIYKSHKYS
jgi:hypothetical protein